MIRILLLLLLAGGSALAQPVRVGPLMVGNNLSEIAAGGSAAQAAARANIGVSAAFSAGCGQSISGSTLAIQFGTSLCTALQGSLLGVANGVAGLNASGFVPLSQLPTIPTTQISGLGTAAAVNTGTSGATVPLLNGANTWSANQFVLSLDNTLYCSQFASLQACHNALPAAGGKMVLPPNTTYSATSTLTISKPNVTLECPSWNTVIQRASAFGTQLVNFTPPSSGGVIRNCTLDGNGTVYTGGYSEIQMNSVNGLIEHNQIINGGGNIAIALAGVNSRATGNTVVGLSSATVGGYGIWAINHVPVKIDHNTISGTKIDGIGFDGTGSQVVGNRVSGAQCTSVGGGQIVNYQGYHNAVISDNTIDASCAIPTVGGGIETNSGDVSVTGNTIQLQNSWGIDIHNNTAGGTLISGNLIRNSGQGGQATAQGIYIDPNVSNVTIVGNRITDDQVTHTQKNAIYISAGASDNIMIQNNDLSGFLTAAITDGGSGSNQDIGHNFGLDNVILPVASTAALPLPINPTISLTGTAGVTSMTGASWTGRLVKFTAAGVVTFTAGNNIANSLTTAAGGLYEMYYDGTLWHLK